jgi:UDP-2,3-diacylglucosamine pyrophosphatase LpxH
MNDASDNGLEVGHVLSDLHLFTHRTIAHDLMDTICDAAAGAGFFVLNGDIFDFRWSVLDSIDATARAAVEWLDQLAEDFPNCRFFYVMGNHDALIRFAPMLDELARRRENFFWHSSHVRIGKALFLHGDLALNVRIRDPLQRELVPGEKMMSPALHLGYRALIASRLHRLIPWVHNTRWCAKRIVRALHEYHPALAEGLGDIYFGHIHKTFTDFEYEGLVFHNTGSAIRHLKNSLLPVRT